MTQKIRVVLSLLVLLHLMPAFGQEMGLAVPDRNGVVKVAGIVQFVEGQVTKTESTGELSPVVYQTPIYEGDRINAPTGSVLKFATRTGCLVVSRGESTIAAMVGKKPWRFRSESLRLICKNKSVPETFGVANVPVAVKDGEVLISGEPLTALALSGQIQIRATTLDLRKLYAVSETVTEASPQPDEEALRIQNENAKPPRESTDWPAPPELPTVRFIFGPVFGGDALFYDASELNQKGLNGDGPRLQAQFKTKDDRSFIVAVTERESQDKNRSNNNQQNYSSDTQNYLEQILVEVGYRAHHDRWWSPFWRVGAGREKVKIGVADYTNTTGNSFYYSSFEYIFYVVSATAGIDANLTPKFLGPIGFHVSAEAQAIQSLWRDPSSRDTSNSNNAPRGPSQQPRRLTSINLGLGLGLEYEF